MLIVEDHELLAQSLSFALRAEGLGAALVMSDSAEAILAAQREHEAQVVLLDLDLGVFGSSVQLIEPLRAGGANVVMLTGATDRIRLAECLEAGAVGIVAKSAPFDELVIAVRRAVSETALMSAHERATLLDELRRHRAAERASHEPFERLTGREGEILDALIDGRQAEAIAQDSFVSVATVRSQIRSVLMKLGVNSQLAAVALARRAGWRSGRTNDR
ncbi:MAG TPA: response regulator transcription factor [Egibacteraceae bacterium]|nr:response regulator transcription factor [Egibacteraceae bacterium]